MKSPITADQLLAEIARLSKRPESDGGMTTREIAGALNVSICVADTLVADAVRSGSLECKRAIRINRAGIRQWYPVYYVPAKAREKRMKGA